MNNKTHVFDVTEANFQEQVLERSLTVPVIVDFWAPWCQPCRTLSPLLEKLAGEYGGRFELAKINVDENPQIAAAFHVQSVPMVFAVQGGQPVDALQGALPAAQIKAFIDRFAPAPEKDPLERGQEALAKGALDVAQRAFEKVLAGEADHGEARVGLARVAMARRDSKRAGDHLDRVKEDDPAFDRAVRLRGVLAFSTESGDAAELRARVVAEPKNVEAWYALGATLAVANALDDAINAFLTVVKLDRSYRDDAGRKALLSLFDLIGADDDRVVRARRRLASLLF